jgi:hypothetical protein
MWEEMESVELLASFQIQIRAPWGGLSAFAGRVDKRGLRPYTMTSPKAAPLTTDTRESALGDIARDPAIPQAGLI